MDFPTGIRPQGRGLRIRIYRKGKVAYSETLAGDCGPRHLKAAIKRRNELEAKFNLGIPLEDQTVWIFKDAAQDYLNTLDAKYSTLTSYRNILRRYWLPEFGPLPISAISTQVIKQKLAALDLSPKTKKNILIPLRSVFDHMEINPNPVTPIRIKAKQKEAVDRYTPQERDALLAQLQGPELAYFALMFCGLRSGEVLGLRWSDWDGETMLVERQITRRRLVNSTKTSYRRRVFIPTWVRVTLNLESRFSASYIFLNQHGDHYKDTDHFNAAWRAAHKRARLRYRIPYTCRHTRAAELLSANIPPAAAAKQMGHSVEMFLRVYSEWIEEYAALQNFDTDYLPTNSGATPSV